MTPRTHRLQRAALGLLAVSMLLTAASPAAAHEGQGILTLESQVADDQGAVRYVVRLTWADDGHPALDSTVTATPITPDGSPQTPITLAPADEDGRYAGTVSYPTPGDWTVRFTSVTPTGTIEITEAVASQATSTTAATTTTSSVPSPDPGDAGPVAREDATAGGEDDSAASGVLRIGLLLVVVAAAVAIIVRSTRHSRGDT